jgi:hypothetical protein
MAAIINAHMTKISTAYGRLHSGGIAIMRPPPISLISISMPAPSHKYAHDATITAASAPPITAWRWRRRLQNISLGILGK